jgi:DTW domain-containing protein
MLACLCAALPQQPIANRWPLHILQHRQEKKHALNTAWIAGLGLVQCQLHAVTDAPVEETLPAALLEELANALLLYPGQQGRHVTHPDFAEMATRPLLILDASWRKSRRLLLTSPWLQALPRISFDLQTPSRYRIRREPAASYCSSLEAACLVLGSLEQDHGKYKPLLATMDLMIGKQIEQMGEETFRRNYSSERDDSQH